MTDDQDPTCDTDDITPEDSVPVGRSHSYMESLVALSAHQAEKNATTDIHRTAPELDTFEAETLRQLLFSPGSEDGHGLPPRHAATIDAIMSTNLYSKKDQRNTSGLVRSWSWSRVWLATIDIFTKDKLVSPDHVDPHVSTSATTTVLREIFLVAMLAVYLTSVIAYIVNDQDAEGNTDYYEEEHCTTFRAFWRQPRSETIYVIQFVTCIVAAFHTFVRYVGMMTEPEEFRVTPITPWTVFRTLVRDERAYIDIGLLIIVLLPLFDNEYDDLWTPSFLHMFNVMRTTRDLILVYLDYFPQDEHIHGIILKTYKLFSTALVSLTTVVFLIERCGLNASYGDEPNLFEALWFTLTTLTTVGYGDLVPANWQGKVLVFLMFFYIIAVLPDLIGELSLSREQFSSLGKEYVPEPGSSHVVVVGGNISVEDMEDFLVDFFASVQRLHRIPPKVVILSPRPKDQDPKVVFNWPKFKGRLFYLHGTALEESDLLRARIRQASAVFVLKDVSDGSAREADGRAILRSWAVHAHCPSVLQYVQVILPESKYHLMGHPNVMPLCLSEMRYAVLANSGHTPGFSTIISMLLFDLGTESKTREIREDLESTRKELAQMDKVHAKLNMSYIKDEVEEELGNARKHYYLHRKRMEQVIISERERRQNELNSVQPEHVIQSKLKRDSRPVVDLGDAASNANRIMSALQKQTEGLIDRERMVERRLHLTPTYPAALESSPYADFVGRLIAHRFARSPSQTISRKLQVSDGVAFVDLFDTALKDAQNLSGRTQRVSPHEYDEASPRWQEDREDTLHAAATLWDQIPRQICEQLGSEYALHREHRGEADEKYFRRLLALQIENLEANLQFSRMCANEIIQVPFQTLRPSTDTPVQPPGKIPRACRQTTQRRGGYHDSVLYNCGDTVIHPGNGFQILAGDTVYYIGQRLHAESTGVRLTTPRVESNSYAQVYTELLAQGATLLAVTLGCTCATEDISSGNKTVPDNSVSGVADEDWHGTRDCLQHHDVCELYEDPYELGGDAGHLAVDVSRAKIGPFREHLLYRGSPSIYAWKCESNSLPEPRCISKIPDVHRIHGAIVVDLTLGRIDVEQNGPYAIIQMIRHFRQLRSTPLNSVEILRPVIFVLNGHPKPNSPLMKALVLTPAVFYAVGDFKRFHTIDALPQVLSTASVILFLANGQEFSRSQVSEDGMIDAEAIRVAHDCEVAYPDAHVVIELTLSKNHRYLRQQLPLRQRNNRSNPDRARRRGHFMFSTPCQNGSVFAVKLANMLCYKLFHKHQREMRLFQSQRTLTHRESEKSFEDDYEPLVRHTESESGYMSVIIQLLGLTANIKRPPAQVRVGPVPLGQVRPPPPPPTTYPYGHVRGREVDVVLLRECHLSMEDLVLSPSEDIRDPANNLDWLISCFQQAESGGGRVTESEIKMIFSGHPNRCFEAFHRPTCERAVARVHAEYSDGLRNADKMHRSEIVLCSYRDDTNRLVKLSLHHAMSILLMPANYGSIAKFLLLRNEAITIGFYRVASALVSAPSDAVHSFLTDTDPKLLDPGRYEARSRVNNSSVMLNPDPEEPVHLGDSLYVIFPAQLCHKPPYALGRFVP